MTNGKGRRARERDLREAEAMLRRDRQSTNQRIFEDRQRATEALLLRREREEMEGDR